MEPEQPHPDPEHGPAHGRLRARPVTADADTGPTGISSTGAAAVYVPPGTAAPRRLVVALHGAGGTAEQGLRILHPVADAANLLVLAPKSAGRTWDVITGGYGPDVAAIDRAVAAVSARYRVRPGPYAIAGFSDGASYALSLGVTNGDLIDAVLAFSPGFLAPLLRVGRPRVYVSHGTADRVLPVDRCGRRVVAELRRDGYDVTYDEFPGGHEVPAGVLDRAVAWLD
ncbi:MAG TPA: PHB depolymerase family esterase [Mycobacteriales bacterium]